MKPTSVKSSFLLGIVSAALASASPAAAGGSPAPAGAAIRVGTYNIRHSRSGGKPIDRLDGENFWELRKADTAALIRRLDLDIFGLQEVYPEQLKYLRETLTDYEFVGDHREADRKSGEASPVCYRKSRFTAEKKGTFWLSETPDVPGSKSWSTAATRICSYLILRDGKTGRKLCFANTHTDHRSELAREKGMLLVIERMKTFGEGAPVIFIGDHNCYETSAPSKAVSKILKSALFVSETPPKGSWRTFNGWCWRDRETSIAEALRETPERRNGKEYRKLIGGCRIDYIYVEPGTRVLDYETVNETRPGKKLYPSDHFPVVATVVLKGG